MNDIRRINNNNVMGGDFMIYRHLACAALVAPVISAWYPTPTDAHPLRYISIKE